MAKNNIGDYSSTAASNTDVGGVNTDENCPAASVNNAIREIMSHLKSAIGAVADFIAGTSTYKWITPKNITDVTAPTSVAYAASYTIDMDALTSLSLTMTLTGNITLNNITNKKIGKTIILELTQDGTGGRTITFGSDYLGPGGLPTLSTTASAIDRLFLTIKSSSVVYVDYGRGYSA